MSFMNLTLRRLPAAVLAVLCAVAPSFVLAQPHHEFKLHKPGLVVTGQAASPAQQQLQLSASTVDFGSVAATTTAKRQVLASNTGGSALTFTAMPQVTGAQAFDAGLTSCGATLPAGADCVAEVLFSPTSVGDFTAQLAFSTSLASSPHKVSLVGTAFSPVSLASASLPGGNTGDAYAYDLKSLLSATGDPAYSPDQVTFSVVAGSLPAGLNLTSAGVLTGTPDVAANAQPFTVRATYKTVSVDQSYALTVTALPSDTYFNRVALLASPEGGTYKDASGYAVALTPGLGVSVDTTIAKFPNTASMKFTGGSTGISVPYSAAKFDMVSTNRVWTVEAWVYLQGPQAGISAYRLDVAGNEASSSGWGTGLNTTGITTTFPGYAGLPVTAAVSSGQWHHLVWQRDNDSFTYAKDGVVVGKVAYAGGMAPNTFMRIGGNFNSSVGITYNIQELRVTTGVTRYPTTTGATYQVPTEPFPRR